MNKTNRYSNVPPEIIADAIIYDYENRPEALKALEDRYDIQSLKKVITLCQDSYCCLKAIKILSKAPQALDKADLWLELLQQDNIDSDMAVEIWKHALITAPSTYKLFYALPKITDGFVNMHIFNKIKSMLSANDLVFLIRNAVDEDLQEGAWELLKEHETIEVSDCMNILMSKSTSFKVIMDIAKLLRKRFNIEEQIQDTDEVDLMCAIYDATINNISKLTTKAWHSAEGHCLAGWACELSPIASRIERQLRERPIPNTDRTPLAAALVIPNAVKFFFAPKKELLEVISMYSGCRDLYKDRIRTGYHPHHSIHNLLHKKDAARR